MLFRYGLRAAELDYLYVNKLVTDSLFAGVCEICPRVAESRSCVSNFELERKLAAFAIGES